MGTIMEDSGFKKDKDTPERVSKWGRREGAIPGSSSLPENGEKNTSREVSKELAKALNKGPRHWAR